MGQRAFSSHSAGSHRIVAGIRGGSRRGRKLYRRLDLLQRKSLFRIAVSIVILLSGSGLFGTLLVKSYSIHSQRFAIEMALRDQNVFDGDSLAVSLEALGTINIQGRTYGGQEILDNLKNFEKID